MKAFDLQKPAYRYLLVGGSVYVFELIVIGLCTFAGWSPVASVGLSYTLGTIVSFVLQKFVTFGDKRTHHKIVLSQFAATCALVVCNFGFTLLVAELLTGVVSAFIARTIALTITTVWNFYLYKTRIFNDGSAKS